MSRDGKVKKVRRVAGTQMDFRFWKFQASTFHRLGILREFLRRDMLFRGSVQWSGHNRGFISKVGGIGAAGVGVESVVLDASSVHGSCARALIW